MILPDTLQKLVGKASVSEVARLNEFGHIAVLNFGQGPVRVEVPPRPFMRYAYELFVSERSEIENKIAKKIFSGKIDARQALGQIGLCDGSKDCRIN